MLKKGLLIGSLLLVSMPNAYAEFYLGPILSYESITSGAIGFQGFTPRLVVGYSGYVKGSFYLAGEVMGGPATITRNNNTSNLGSLKTTYSYGFSVTPGVALDEAITSYVRAGVLTTHFSSLNKTETGFQRGIGLQTKIGDAWAVRAEYDYVSYTTFAGISSPGEDQYSVGFIYWFA